MAVWSLQPKKRRVHTRSAHQICICMHVVMITTLMA